MLQCWPKVHVTTHRIQLHSMLVLSPLEHCITPLLSCCSCLRPDVFIILIAVQLDLVCVNCVWPCRGHWQCIVGIWPCRCACAARTLLVANSAPNRCMQRHDGCAPGPQHATLSDILHHVQTVSTPCANRQYTLSNLGCHASDNRSQCLGTPQPFVLFSGAVYQVQKQIGIIG